MGSFSLTVSVPPCMHACMCRVAALQTGSAVGSREYLPAMRLSCTLTLSNKQSVQLEIA